MQKLDAELTQSVASMEVRVPHGPTVSGLTSRFQLQFLY